MNTQLINDIAAQIDRQKKCHPMETVNLAMMKTLMDCANRAKNVTQFKALVKSETGLTAQGFDNCRACQWIIQYTAWGCKQ